MHPRRSHRDGDGFIEDSASFLFLFAARDLSSDIRGAAETRPLPPELFGDCEVMHRVRTTRARRFDRACEGTRSIGLLDERRKFNGGFRADSAVHTRACTRGHDLNPGSRGGCARSALAFFNSIVSP